MLLFEFKEFHTIYWALCKRCLLFYFFRGTSCFEKWHYLFKNANRFKNAKNFKVNRSFVFVSRTCNRCHPLDKFLLMFLFFLHQKSNENSLKIIFFITSTGSYLHLALTNYLKEEHFNFGQICIIIACYSLELHII